MDKLSIANEMTQFDRKNREFYNELTDEERKRFSNYLMIRWGSAVQGSREHWARARNPTVCILSKILVVIVK
jgi:hypothetical protein